MNCTSFAGCRLTSGKAVSELDKWKKLQHINIITLKEMFTTKAFGDNCKICKLAVNVFKPWLLSVWYLSLGLLLVAYVYLLLTFLLQLLFLCTTTTLEPRV